MDTTTGAVQIMRDFIRFRAMRERQIITSSRLTDDEKKRVLDEEGFMPLIRTQFSDVRINVDL